MTDEELFNELFDGGSYSLPYLIHFSHLSAGDLYFVNSNQDVTFNNITYKAANFSYTEPDYQGNGASLSFSLIDNDLTVFLDKADENATITIDGVINQNGTITQIKTFNHSYFSANWGTDLTLSLSFSLDDRFNMTFPPYVFDSDNNRGGN